MAKILEMPKLSPTMEEGVLSAWHKKEGDEVNVDDLLAEVETDKATMEFRAFDKGTLLKLLVEAGATVKLGQAVGILGEKGEDIAALVAQAGGGSARAEAPADEAPASEEAKEAKAPAGKERAASPAEGAAPEEVPAAAPEEQRDTTPPNAERRPATGPAKPAAPKSALDRTERDEPIERASAAPAEPGRVVASPYVRKAARDRGIDLAGAQGSGPGGRVVAKDLDALAGNAGAAAAQSRALARGPDTQVNPRAATTPARHLAEPEARPLSMMRKTIARRLTEAKQTVPHFYLTIDVDAGELAAFRDQVNRELEGSPAKLGDADKPLKVSLNDLLIKACAVALTRVPECNAQFSAEAILVHKRVDVSVAVAVPDGLVTPVVRDADRKSVVAIAREVRDLAARARAKKLKPEEMQDGTFSISNLGMFGIDAFSAVINPPEGAILAVGRVRDEPVVQGGQVVAGKRLSMTLSCDHRVVDGAVGAAFLAELRALLEHPMRIVTG